MPVGENIFSVEDYRGKTVVFTKKKLKEKLSDHPELNKASFIKCVKNAITEPDEVWQDLQDKKSRRCYYKKYSKESYAKVVIWEKGNPCAVIMAFEIDRVKEYTYPTLKRIR